MKTLLILLITITSYSQVGINTTEPTAMLDVNGTARVRVFNNSDSPYFVVAERDGTLNVRALPNIPPWLFEERIEIILDKIRRIIYVVMRMF